VAGDAAERAGGVRDGDAVCQDRCAQRDRHDVRIAVVCQHVRRKPVAVRICVELKPTRGVVLPQLVCHQLSRPKLVSKVAGREERAELTAGHDPDVGGA
jgi:hypothetical protein